MTYEHFLDAIDEDTLAEWVDGRVIMASPASRRHQEIAELLFMMLSTFAKVHASGVVISPPFQMKLARSGREPATRIPPLDCRLSSTIHFMHAHI